MGDRAPKKKGVAVPDQGRATKAGAARSTPDIAFNEYLRRGLHEIYDGVAQEPVPEELLRLIRRDSQK